MKFQKSQKPGFCSLTYILKVISFDLYFSWSHRPMVYIEFFYTLLTVSPCLHTRLSRLLERFFGSPSSSMSWCVDAQVTHLTAPQRIRCHGTDFTADKTAKWHNFGVFFDFLGGETARDLDDDEDF